MCRPREAPLEKSPYKLKRATFLSGPRTAPVLHGDELKNQKRTVAEATVESPWNRF